EIGDRQRQQVAKQARSQFDVDAIGGVGKKVGAKDAEDRFENANRHQADNQYIERRHATMHEHLVDDDLKEERRDEREDLKEERSDQHLAEQVAILVNGPQEPGKIDSAR